MTLLVCALEREREREGVKEHRQVCLHMPSGRLPRDELDAGVAPGSWASPVSSTRLTSAWIMEEPMHITDHCFAWSGLRGRSCDQKSKSNDLHPTPDGERVPCDQRELNGTCLMVHAGNCWQLFLQFVAVFCMFFSCVARKFQSLGSAVFAVFSHFPARAIKRPPMQQSHLPTTTTCMC